ncbi:hypothetical protein ABPG72_003845 [Tetrahymena utriculariae]
MSGKKYAHIIKDKIDELFYVKNLTSGWKVQKKENIFTHSTIKYHQLKLPLNKIEGVFPTNYEKTINYLQNCYQNKQRNEMCSQFDLTQQVDENTFIGHLLNKGKLIFSPRELIVVQNRYNISENESLITRSSIENHDDINPNTDAVRAEAKIYGIFLKKLNEFQTQFEAYLIIDLKGNIPNFANNIMIDKYIEIFEKDITYIKSH